MVFISQTLCFTITSKYCTHIYSITVFINHILLSVSFDERQVRLAFILRIVSCFSSDTFLMAWSHCLQDILIFKLVAIATGAFHVCLRDEV